MFTKSELEVITEALQARGLKLVGLQQGMSIDHQECIQGDIDVIKKIINKIEEPVRLRTWQEDH